MSLSYLVFSQCEQSLTITSAIAEETDPILYWGSDGGDCTCKDGTDGYNNDCGEDNSGPAKCDTDGETFCGKDNAEGKTYNCD